MLFDATNTTRKSRRRLISDDSNIALYAGLTLAVPVLLFVYFVPKYRTEGLIFGGAAGAGAVYLGSRKK